MKLSRLAPLIGALLLGNAGHALCQGYGPQSNVRDESRGGLLYRPGKGLPLGSSNVTLAGYWDVNFRDLRNEEATLSLDDLSFFGTYSPSAHWQAFTEMELEDAVNVDEDGDVFSGTAVFQVERAYLEYRHSDALALRVGKFLTPIGIWNPIHAAPLVWTVARPATTEDLFDPATTGLMVFGSSVSKHLELNYSAYVQVTDQLLERGGFRDKRRSAGWRVSVTPTIPLTIGFSSEFMKNETRSRWEQLVGADLRYDGRRLELWSEAAANTPLGGGATEWGIYLQAAFRLYGNLFVVGRFEHIKLERSANAPLIGLNFRPYPFLVLKAEYVLVDRPVADVRRGLALSVAGLF